MEAVAITHLDAPGLTAQIGEALDDPNPDVVTDALLAIQGAETEAVSSYRQKIMGLAKRSREFGGFREGSISTRVGGEP